MFWRFGGYANISTLDSILDKPDVTLEELLDESDLIQELKAQNARLIEFLREDSILERLLGYVIAQKPSSDTETTDPSAEEETKRASGGSGSGGGGFFASRSKARSKSRDVHEADSEKLEAKRTKYAFVSCEILSSEVYSLYESLLANPGPLREFWQFIKRPAPLDVLQAGYFTKVNEAILEKKTEDMIAFIKTLPDVVSDMMKHVDCPMLMDLLLKLISLEKEPEGHGVVDWLQSQGLIPKLLAYITPDHPAATQTSAGDFLKAVITISANATGQDNSVIGPNELTRQLVSEKCVNSLITEMLRGGNPLTVGVGIVIEVIRKNNSDYDSEAQIGPEPRSSDPIYLGTLLRAFANHIPDFMALILSSRHTVMTDKGSTVIDRKDLKVAWGDRIEPLGFDRFKTCELMAELLHCSNMGLLNERGSDAAVKARDAERERLKAEGSLSSAPQSQSLQADFGTSVDSAGFHHADASTHLGESPDELKKLEVQNSGGEEDEFEKVAMSEAIPEGAHGTSLDGSEDPGVRDAAVSDNAPLSPTSDSLAYEVENLGLDDTTPPAITSHPPRTSSKQPISLLTQQIEAEKNARLSDDIGLGAAEHLADAPAPLFSSRNNEKPSPDGKDDSVEGAPKSATANDSEQQNLPVIEREEDGSPVVGDLLKIKFVDNQVVPTILDFFFRFPWNNFLHNVVYDVVQQVFNGPMDRGYTRTLAIDLFETGRITERVIEGQQRSDKAQADRGMRLGYMGHLTLIAEEVVKFTERQPAELLAPSAVAKVTDPAWIEYVEHVLTETRDRDNAILGGVRPDAAGGARQAVLNSVSGGPSALGNSGSSALANAGIGANNSQGLDSMDLANANNGGYGLSGGNLLSGFGSSDDEDDDELEEGEFHESAQDEYSGSTDDAQSGDRHSSTPTNSTEASQNTNTPSIPAPLSIAPSRARRQLAVRLAEKQRLATSGDAASDPDPQANTQGDSAAMRSNASIINDKPVGGYHDNLKGFGSDSDEDGHHSSDDEAGDSDDDIKGITGLKRQTMREASREERRPLDDGDSDDDDPPPMRQSSSDEDVATELGGQDLDVEDYWRLGELRQAAAERAAAEAKIQVADATRSVPAGVAASAKQREQERLLQQWGLAERQPVEVEEDDDDDDDEPVEMGTKYLKRRPSRDAAQP